MQYCKKITPVILILLLPLHLHSKDAIRKIMDDVATAIQKQDWRQTAELGKKLINKAPDNIWGHYYYGLGLSYTGRMKEGEESLKYVISKDKNHFWANYILFFNYILQNHKEKLEQAARVDRMITPSLIKSNPAEIRPFFQTYADLLQKNRQLNKSREVLKKGIMLFPKDPVLYSQYAFTYFRVDMKKWKEFSMKSLSLVPENEMNALNIYRLPLKGDRIIVHQGNNGKVSHQGVLNCHAWDFIHIDKDGRYFGGKETRDNYYTFGKPVYAALDGKVIRVIDQYPDTEPRRNNPAAEANMIVILHANNETSYYIHIKKNSSLVRVGDTVKTGQEIARIGSSGRYVDIPHLHFQVNRNGICVKTQLTGFETLIGNKWINTGTHTPEEKEILRRLK